MRHKQRTCSAIVPHSRAKTDLQRVPQGRIDSDKRCWCRAGASFVAAANALGGAPLAVPGDGGSTSTLSDGCGSSTGSRRLRSAGSSSSMLSLIPLATS